MGRRAAKFVTIEGSDGSGKSTLLSRIEAHLEALKLPYVTTREPGGTPLAEEIRDLILKPGRTLDPRAELLLFEAARAEHVTHLIRPSLDAGKHVLCDRFTHSSLAYQGVGRGLGNDIVTRLNEFATAGLEPDAVIWLRLPPAKARARVAARTQGGAEASRIDTEAAAFHDTVFAAFEAMAAREPGRFVVLDASAKPDEIFDELLKHRTWRALFEGHSR